jgi:hypothetical protein|tara:strand:- start:181 stop:777 length:597 start_codon:yes stop_codon:yes gene_type:complete
MVIIRRNPDGTIAQESQTKAPPRHPALSSAQGMAALADSGKSGFTLFSEIATKVNNAKDKPRKLRILRENDTQALRQICRAAFDDKIKWALPPGDVPYIPNEAPLGTEHTLLSQEAKRLYIFIEGGDNTISATKRETLFIQLLEGLSAEESAFLLTVKDKKVNNEYKGFTANLVKEAFNWNDDFMKKPPSGTSTANIS